MTAHTDFPWLDEHGTHGTRTYLYPFDRDGLLVDLHPQQCADCDRPCYYDETDESYHHALDCGDGCFLIPAEDRRDDLTHPLLAGGDRGVRHPSTRGEGYYWAPSESSVL